MKKKYLFSMATAFLLAVAGCSDDLEKGSDNQGKPLDGEGVYLTVNIMTPASSGTGSRATGDATSDPTGGEYGDGNLLGFKHENDVNEVTIILYQGESINDGTAQIVSVGYEGNVEQQGYVDEAGNHHYKATVLLDGNDLLKDTEYHVLAIVNQDVSGQFTKGALLTQCLNEQTNEHYRNASEAEARFVMSTHQESQNGVSSTVKFNGDETTSEAAAITTVWVERLSARIDYIGDKDAFTVKNSEDAEIATVTLDAVAPINVGAHPMYLFKRVTENADISSGRELLGDELPIITVPDPYAPAPAEGENYVLEPTTSSTDPKITYFKNKFDANLLTTIKNNPDNALKWRSISAIKDKPTEPVITIKINETTGEDESTSNYIEYQNRILCYAGENTMEKSAQLHKLSTGVIFRAVYNPAKVYDLVDNELKEVDASTGKGFYRVGTLKRHNVMNEGSVLYADLEAAEAACIANEKSSDTQKAFGKGFNTDTYFTSLTWSELQGLVNGIGTDLGYKAYLNGKISAQSDKNVTISNGADLTWDAYKASRSNKFPEEGEADNASIEEEGNLAIHYYGTGHLCYYQYWIRHANNGKPNEMGVMEFCIVRNNVYQLNVTGVDGLGMPDPYDNIDTPDEGEDPKGYYLRVQLYVKDWVKRLNDDIVLQ